LLGILEPHQVFTGKDPYWSQHVIYEAQAHGFEADEQGRMIKPANYEEIRQSVAEELLRYLE
jgi:hypothetical protein